MLTIHKDQVMLCESGTLTAEASEIGLPPGEWPDFIAIVDDDDKGFLFQKQVVDTMAGTYKTKDGTGLLMVWND